MNNILITNMSTTTELVILFKNQKQLNSAGEIFITLNRVLKKTLTFDIIDTDNQYGFIITIKQNKYDRLLIAEMILILLSYIKKFKNAVISVTMFNNTTGCTETNKIVFIGPNVKNIKFFGKYDTCFIIRGIVDTLLLMLDNLDGYDNFKSVLCEYKSI